MFTVRLEYCNDILKLGERLRRQASRLAQTCNCTYYNLNPIVSVTALNDKKVAYTG